LPPQNIIADPESLTRCLANQVGEIWVSGPHVAQGYWQRSEQTEATFNAYLADTKAGPFLRTGDLGFVQNGELFVTGRIKDVIIIRGRNHYPQDIELTVENSHPALKPGSGAAFTVEVDGEERLVIAQEVERTYIRKLDVEEVVEAIRRVVSIHHELQLYAVVLLKTGSIFKTSSGKIQRQACRAAFLADTFSVVGNWQSEPIQQSPQNSPPVAANNSKSRADDLINWLRNYAGERINSRIIDERRCIPPYIVLDFGNRGILGMQVPEQYGGIALSNRDTLRVIEQLAAIDLTLASFVGVHHALGTRPLMNYATSSVRDQFLPLIAQGRELGAFAITEPCAGSNPRGILSQAIPDSQGGWRLRGQKEWIGTGAWAGIINVFVQLLNENHQPIGITGFMIRQGTKGLRQGPEALTMGMRGMVQNKIYLDDVSVTSEHLLGELGGGLEVAQDAMMFGRLGLGAMSIGGMKRCTQLMLRYGSRRSISTGRLIDNPLTLNRLTEITAAITTLETLVFRIADLLDQGYSLPEEAYAACKTSGPEFLWQAADHLVQLLGGRGYIETNIAPQILRDARLLRIFEGPTETLNMFLGSRILNKSAELDNFLCVGLEAPEIAEVLKAAITQINAQFTNSKNNVESRQWLYLRTGELTTWAILLAALAGKINRCDADHLQRAFTWARLNFEQKLTNLLNGTPAELIRDDADVIANQIYNYTDTIGDIEQVLAGEDTDLDQLLKQGTGNREQGTGNREQGTGNREQGTGNREQGTESREHFDKLSASQGTVNNFPNDVHTELPKEIVPSTKNSFESVGNWIEKWLAEKLRIDINKIDVGKSFADYGMDSVMAVELAQELEEWLDRPLEATIIWNFPTIESLCKYLTNEIPDLPVEKPISSHQNQPAELDLEALINQEISELENLLEQGK
jgi:alkylation response protein AidB-like acyl-CoA dehydrogenase/acyl carrier protein